MPWLLALPASRRKHALSALVAVLILTLLAPAAVLSAPLTSVFVNGVRLDSYPEIRNGVSYLPINAMAQALQVEISWDSRLNLVKVNGEAISATAYNIDGRIFLPVEAFVSALGGSVSYDGRENAIKVKTGGLATLASRPSTGAATTVAVTPRPLPAATPQPRTTIPIPPVSVTPTTAPVTVPVSRPSAGAQGGGYQANTTAPGYPAPYSPNPQVASAQPRPVDAPPYLQENLQTGPAMNSSGGTQSNVAYAPLPANATRPVDGVYVPRSAQNAVFQVTVTNMENVTVIKDFYRPRTGYKFVVVYLSQQNVSEQVQIYTGKFSLLDQKNTSYDYIEGLSNFWLVILRPFGINFGYLVFEVPVDAKPMSLVLHALNQAPLSLNL